MVRLLRLSRKKAPGDVGVSLMGLFLSLLAAFVFVIVLQIQQINLLYEETDEALALSVLSSAVINREDAYSSQQIVIHELDQFKGDITSDAALNILGSTDDIYLQEAYNYFLQTFTDNFRLDTNLIPKNPLINSNVSVIEYNVYNVWHELDEDGFRTGNFRTCKHSYDPESGIWDTTWFPLNEVITVPDALTQTNIPVECSLVSAQIKMNVTKLPFISGVFEESSSLSQDVYYVRNADIIEHEDIIKDREDSAGTNGTSPPGTRDIPYYVRHYWQNIVNDDYTLVDVQERRGDAGEEVTPAVKDYDGFTPPEEQTVTIAADGSTIVDYYYNRNSYTLILNNGTGIRETDYYSYDRGISDNNYDPSLSISVKYGERIELNSSVLNGYTWSHWNGTYYKDDKNHVFMMPPYDVNLTANATLNIYTINYVLNGGTQGSGAVNSYTVKDTVILPIPTKAGYNFGGWYTNSDLSGTAVTVISEGSTGDKVFYAKWTIKSFTVTYKANSGLFDNAYYTVNHYQQNISNDEYTLVDTKTLAGPINATITPDVYTYEGFTSPSSETVIIKADGTTVVNYYYKRNRYTVTYKGNSGLFDNAYYTVNHYQQNISDDEYTLVDTKTLVGPINATITPDVYAYKGFTSPPREAVIIKADGTTVVNYYYERNRYTVTYKGNGGLFHSTTTK